MAEIIVNTPKGNVTLQFNSDVTATAALKAYKRAMDDTQSALSLLEFTDDFGQTFVIKAKDCLSLLKVSK